MNEANFKPSSLPRQWRVPVWLLAGLLGVVALPLLISKYSSNTVNPAENRGAPSEQAVVAAKKTETEVAPICVTAIDLASQYQYSKESADAKYKGKILIIKGVIDHRRLDPREMDIKADSVSVRAIGKDVSAFSALKPAQQVTVECKGDGTWLPLTVSSCSIVPPQTACIAEPDPVRSNRSTIIELNLTPELRGQLALISGTTNLMDGAILNYEVDHENVNGPWSISGKLTVTGGRYAGAANVAAWPRGKIRVAVYFATLLKEQPSWVKVQFGELGQNMEGPTVKAGGQGIKIAQVEKTLVKR